MPEIEVTERDHVFLVKVREGKAETEHTVDVPDGYLSQLGLPDADKRELVEQSFRFLLEREPKESIMRTFELSVIQRYFPEYPQEIKRRLTSG